MNEAYDKYPMSADPEPIIKFMDDIADPGRRAQRFYGMDPEDAQYIDDYLNTHIFSPTKGTSEIMEAVRDTVQSAQDSPPPGRIDPLILDLDGDGIETTNVTNGVYFDHDGNGFEEQSAWVESDDGLLAWDRNGDGHINDGKELFGDQTILQDGTRAANGFQAIAEWDDNADGKIDASDVIWANLKIWQDTDGDGYTLAGELKSLSDFAVQAINLGHTTTNTTEAQGNIQARLGSFTKTDGTAGQMGDYLLDRNTTYTLAQEWLDVPEDIAALADLKGYGNVYDLHQAMVRDVSGTLKTLVQTFSTQTSANERNATVEAILFKWTGSDVIDPTSRGLNIDARKLAVLEKFLGQSFAGTTGANPNANAAPLLNQAYQGLYEMVSAQLMAQTHLKGLYDLITYTWNESTESLQGNLSGVITEIQNRLALDPVAGQALLGEFARSVVGLRTEAALNFTEFRTAFANQGEQLGWVVDSAGKNVMTGTATADSLSGTGGSDAIQGGDGNDTLSGNTGNDVLYGEAGADTLYGNAGDDLLLGGSDNDSLDGGLGNDVYLFGRGSGRDTVYDYDTTAGNTDVIRLAADVLPSDVVVWRGTNDLYLSIGAVTGSEDRIAITNWFTNTANHIERIEFADGTVWGTAVLGSAPILGTANAEALYGTAGDDLFDGGAGNDTLYGNNTSTGTGNDTYIPKRGNGQDTIVDSDTAAGNLDTIRAVGLLPSEVTLGRDTYSLILKINGGTDQMTVYNWFANTANRVERVVFDDGTVWDTTSMAAAPILGTVNAETLYGTAGDVLFDGGAGNDTLYGNNTSTGTGNDTYLLKRGNGQDTVVDSDSAAGNLDTIRTVGLMPSEVTLGRDTYSLVLKINGTADQMTVYDWFANTANRVERVVFDDGTVWDTTSMAAAPILGTANAETLYGTAGDDLFDGGGGNDTLYGYNNSYGTGNDTYLLKRGNGQDTIVDYDPVAGNLDTIRVVGLLPSEVTLGQDTYSLILKINGGTDQITVSNWFANTASRIERVVFDDGTVWDTALLATAPILGTTGNDTLYGTVGDDLFDGGTGNDMLYGYTSSGYDSGNDTYRFGAGAGQDTISDYGSTAGNVDTVKIVGKLPSDIAVSRRVDQYGNLTNDLVLKINGTTDQLTLQNYFVAAGGAYKVEKVQFDDGTVWDMALLGSAAIMGTAVANTLSGSADADLIQGLGGNDTLSGNAGNDIMQGGADNDTISDTSGNNLFDGGAGIDTLTGGSGRELFIGGSGNDTVTTGLGACRT
ncbi:MAG: calcium-binding protein [Gammaproteobacteria bacterium]